MSNTQDSKNNNSDNSGTFYHTGTDNNDVSFIVWRLGEHAQRTSKHVKPENTYQPVAENDESNNPIRAALGSRGPYFSKADMELAHGELMLSNTRSLRGIPERGRKDSIEISSNMAEKQWGLGSIPSNPFFADSEFGKLIDSQDNYLRGRGENV